MRPRQQHHNNTTKNRNNEKPLFAVVPFFSEQKSFFVLFLFGCVGERESTVSAFIKERVFGPSCKEEKEEGGGISVSPGRVGFSNTGSGSRALLLFSCLRNTHLSLFNTKGNVGIGCEFRASEKCNPQLKYIMSRRSTGNRRLSWVASRERFRGTGRRISSRRSGRPYKFCTWAPRRGRFAFFRGAIP